MRRDVAYTASRRVGCYVGTYQMPHRDVISTVSSKTYYGKAKKFTMH